MSIERNIYAEEHGFVTNKIDEQIDYLIQQSKEHFPFMLNKNNLLLCK
jgi:hypothetical protein